METTARRHTFVNVAALFLCLPTVYFIFISVLKYMLNIDGPFDNAWPLLERLGATENIGWNINLLILFGPVIAFVLTFFQVFHFRWNFNNKQFDFHITLEKKWFPLSVAFISGLSLVVLLVYIFGENLNA